MYGLMNFMNPLDITKHKSSWLDILLLLIKTVLLLLLVNLLWCLTLVLAVSLCNCGAGDIDAAGFVTQNSIHQVRFT